MKIDYAIVSSDDNPLYFEFWEIVKRLWIDLIGIKPILVKISDNDNVEDFGNYIIHNIKSVEGVDTGFQSQVARMYVTKYYQDYVCLTSDIDMLPLSKKYFTENIQVYNNDSLVIFSSDAYKDINRYPICYNAAKGKIFDEILQFDESFEDYTKKLLSFGWGWDTDELFFGMKVNSFENQDKIIKMVRGWERGIAPHRIDRSKWEYSTDELIKQNYIDSHSLRPYSEHKTEINKLVNTII
jgi:hypothetical protein